LRATLLDRVNLKLKETQVQLETLALYDELTERGNRSLFRQQLESLVAMSKRNEQRFGLLILDLNGFKNVNDMLGHDAGDIVLQAVAKRLKETLRESDQAFRLGGDEFAVLLGPDFSSEGLIAVAEKIDGAMRRPIQLRSEDHVIGVSIGAAMFPNHGHNFAELTRKADAAMYEAKTHGRASAVATDLGATTVMKSLRESDVA
jgi:diguanylate cyclase (GGDEF)-like protein